MRSRVVWVLWLLGLGGCTAHSLRCDGALSPINIRSVSTGTHEHPASKQPVPVP